MNLLVQKLKYSLFLVLLLASSAVAQEGLRKTDVNAILVMEDGTERPGIMRMATSNKSKPIYKFQEEGSTKFSSLKTDGVSHMFVKTRDGQKYLFVNAPLRLPRLVGNTCLGMENLVYQCPQLYRECKQPYLCRW